MSNIFSKESVRSCRTTCEDMRPAVFPSYNCIARQYEAGLFCRCWIRSISRSKVLHQLKRVIAWISVPSPASSPIWDSSLSIASPDHQVADRFHFRQGGGRLLITLVFSSLVDQLWRGRSHYPLIQPPDGGGASSP